MFSCLLIYLQECSCNSDRKRTRTSANLRSRTSKLRSSRTRAARHSSVSTRRPINLNKVRTSQARSVARVQHKAQAAKEVRRSGLGAQVRLNE
jgi:hypothetical protein